MTTQKANESVVMGIGYQAKLEFKSFLSNIGVKKNTLLLAISSRNQSLSHSSLIYS